jgi:hypothetical protein
MYVSSVSATIAAGTSEIQRNVIATRGLVHRHTSFDRFD